MNHIGRAAGGLRLFYLTIFRAQGGIWSALNVRVEDKDFKPHFQNPDDRGPPSPPDDRGLRATRITGKRSKNRPTTLDRNIIAIIGHEIPPPHAPLPAALERVTT